MKNGFLLLFNYIRELIGRRFGEYLPGFFVDVAPENYLLTITPVLILGAAILICLFTQIYRGRSIWVHLALFGLMTVVFYLFPNTPLGGSLLVMGAYLFSLTHALGKRYGESRQILFSRVLLSFIVVTGMGMAMNHFGVISWIQTIEEKEIYSVRYELGKPKMLPEGDFRDLGGRKNANKTALKIMMNQPESYYLRGFVGSTYTGVGFDEADSEKTYLAKKLSYELKPKDFHAEIQMAEAAKIVMPEETQEIQAKVQIKEASSRYWYLPYELSANEEGYHKSNPDINAKVYRNGDFSCLSKSLFGSNSYGFSALRNHVGSYTELAEAYENSATTEERLRDFRTAESYYNVFVYENDLSLSEEMRHLCYEILGEYDTDGQNHYPYFEAKKEILEYLNTNQTYDTSVGNVNPDMDFIKSFLLYEKRGYDVHYASAATLMYRYYGIPARYVEGYLVTPDDVAGVEPYEEITITGANAHSWVEIYQDGIGWVPIEVTPPYLTVMEQPSDVTATIGSATGEKENLSPSTIIPLERAMREHRSKPSFLPSRWLWFLLLSVGLVLLFLFGYLLRIWYKRWKTKKKKQAGFCLPDRNEAICNLFLEYRRFFDGIPKIVEKAAFSRQTIEEEEYHDFYQNCISLAKAAK